MYRLLTQVSEYSANLRSSAASVGSRTNLAPICSNEEQMRCMCRKLEPAMPCNN